MSLSSPLFLLVSLTALMTVTAAPVPIPKESENVVEEEDGLLVLVPTVPVDGKGQPTKREIDYELISIPGDLIRKTVKEVTEAYGTRGGPLPDKALGAGSPASIYISNLNDDDGDEIIINTETDLKTSSSRDVRQSIGSDSGDFLRSFDDVPANLSPTTTYSSSSGEKSQVNVISTADLSKLLSSLTSTGFSAATKGANIAGQAKSALTTATRVGASAVVGGTQAVRWALQQKASGLRSFAEFAGAGLQYAGRLTSAVLKVLLRIPGIKAKVISDLIQAGQPFASALSDVIVESADDLGDIFAAQSDIFRDAVNILFKLIQDVLSLQGRVLASFSAGGLDKGANLVSSGVKVGSAFVQTAGDVVSSVGRGIGEFVQVISESNLPPPPALPTIKFPVLPSITYPSSSAEKYTAPAPSYKSPSAEVYTSTGEAVKESYNS